MIRISTVTPVYSGAQYLEALVGELAALRSASQVITREDTVLDVAGGRVRAVEMLAFGGAAPHSDTPLDVAGEAALLVDRSSNTVLRRVEQVLLGDVERPFPNMSGTTMKYFDGSSARASPIIAALSV